MLGSRGVNERAGSLVLRGFAGNVWGCGLGVSTMRGARDTAILELRLKASEGAMMMGSEIGCGGGSLLRGRGGFRRMLAIAAGGTRIRAYVLAAMVALVAVPASASAYIYWPHNRAPARDGAIGRAHVDGSAPNPTLVTGTDGVYAVAVSGTHVYWTHSTLDGAGAIGRANLDGSDANPNFITGLHSPRGIGVEGTHIYWADFDPAAPGPGDFGRGLIGRANLDGSDVNQNFIKERGHGAPPAHPTALAVDRNHIYFSDPAFSVLVIARIDGHGPWRVAEVRGVGIVNGIAAHGAHIYWTWTCPNPNIDCARSRGIGRMNLNGTALDRNFIDVPARGVAVDAQHIYWAEDFERGRIGRANLDGSALDPNFIADVRSPSGVGVGPRPHPIRRP
jgi:hypothetical protein